VPGGKSLKHVLDEILERVRVMPADEQAELVRAAQIATKDRVWMPTPGPQTLALDCLADELLYGGEAGGGKTDLGIGLALTEHRRSLLLRRLNAEVSGLVDRTEEILGTRKGFSQTPHAVWRLPQRIVLFGGCQHLDDRKKYQGVPKDLIFFDELANFLEAQYTFIIGWARSTIPGQRVRVVAASNPPVTPEGLWINKRWGAWLDKNHPNPALPGELRWYTTIDDIDTEVEGPGPVIIDGKPLLDARGQPILPKSRTYIPAELNDNPDLADSGYGATLAALPPELRGAMFEGDFSRGMLDDQWQVFPTMYVELAMSRWHEGGSQQKMDAIGVDIAQGGSDQTVLAPRHGGWFDRLKVYRGADTPDGASVAGLIFMTMKDGCEIILDMGGGYGGGTREHLKQAFQVTLYNGTERGMGTDRSGALKFANKRAEATWRLREALDPEYGSALALPPDNELKADLCALRWRHTTQGILIESKDDVKKRIGRSPDRGDAVIMAHYARGKTDHVPRGISNLQRKATVSNRRPPRRG
jgi:hypothetical protein